MDGLNSALYGALAAMSATAGLFFARYWRSTGDRFFGFIATSFVCLAANWASLVRWNDEHAAWFYLPRLGAFAILLIGIVDKNRTPRKSSEKPSRGEPTIRTRSTAG